LEQLQQQFNDHDVDRVVDLVLDDVLDNDITKMERPPNGPQFTNQWRFELALIGGPSKNLIKLNSLSLPNFPMYNYMPLSAVPQPALYVLPL
jgi:hypothetical protein